MELENNCKVECQIRQMCKEDIPGAMEVFKQSGWVVGVDHIYTLFEIDPKGWQVAVSNTDEILGVCCVIIHDEDFAFAGYWAVKKGCRKMGIGEKITDSVIKYGGTRNIGLAAATEMFQKYKDKGDFTHADTDSLFSYKSDKKLPVENLSSMIPEGVTIVPYEDSHLPAMLEYDASLGEISHIRRRLIELNSKERQSKTFVAFKKSVCVGFGTIVISLLGIPRLAPLYADDAETAEAIMKKLLQSFPDNHGLFMTTFAANKAANDLMDKIKCPKIYEAFHMYTKKDRVLPFKASIHRMFAQFDLGCTEY